MRINKEDIKNFIFETIIPATIGSVIFVSLMIFVLLHEIDNPTLYKYVDLQGKTGISKSCYKEGGNMFTNIVYKCEINGIDQFVSGYKKLKKGEE